MSLLQVAAVQIGKSATAAQNFVARTLLDGAFRLSRGNADAPGADVIKIDAANDVTLAGNLLNGVLGAGQTWQNVTASRALNTSYTNTTGKPIVAYMNITMNAANSVPYITVGGLVFYGNGQPNIGSPLTLSVIIPPGAVYFYNAAPGAQTTLTIMELR